MARRLAFWLGGGLTSALVLTALLGAVKQKARALGATNVRLDVIDINTRARALYERQGFVARETSDAGLFAHVFGFRSSTRMICML